MKLHLLISLLTLTLSLSASADDKKGGKKDSGKKDSAVDAFFDDAPKQGGTSLDALKNAANDVAHKEKKGLAPKTNTIDDEAKVQFFTAFAAEKIVIDKKLGCQPGGRDKKKLTYFAFDEVPAEGVAFSICVTLQSKAGREVAMSAAIVDPRNAKISRAEDVVDFRGRSARIDHVLDFPAPVFKVPGPYVYLIEIDGKEAARLPLFEVKIDTAPQ